MNDFDLKYQVIIDVPNRDPIRFESVTPFMGFSVGDNIVGGVLSNGEHIGDYSNLQIISINHMFHVSEVEIGGKTKEQTYHRIDIETKEISG